MKYPLPFVCMVAFSVAAGTLLRIPQRSVPAPACAYVLAHALFCLVGWFGLQRDSSGSASYLKFYSCMFGAVLCLAIWTAWRLLLLHPPLLAGFVAIGAMFLSAAISSVSYFHMHEDWRGDIPTAYLAALVQGAILMACGVVALLAVTKRLEPALHVVACSLGAFWIAMAVLSFAFATQIGRKYEPWVNMGDLLPAIFGIIFAVVLTVQLSSLQSEGSLQPLPDVAAREAHQ
jgi:hypothetical protein